MRELEELINDINQAAFAKDVLKLGKLPIIETKKLVLLGH